MAEESFNTPSTNAAKALADADMTQIQNFVECEESKKLSVAGKGNNLENHQVAKLTVCKKFFEIYKTKYGRCHLDVQQYSCDGLYLVEVLSKAFDDAYHSYKRQEPPEQNYNHSSYLPAFNSYVSEFSQHSCSAGLSYPLNKVRKALRNRFPS